MADSHGTGHYEQPGHDQGCQRDENTKYSMIEPARIDCDGGGRQCNKGQKVVRGDVVDGA